MYDMLKNNTITNIFYEWYKNDIKNLSNLGFGVFVFILTLFGLYMILIIVCTIFMNLESRTENQRKKDSIQVTWKKGDNMRQW